MRIFVGIPIFSRHFPDADWIQVALLTNASHALMRTRVELTRHGRRLVRESPARKVPGSTSAGRVETTNACEQILDDYVPGHTT